MTDSTSNITRFHYDGDALIGEYNASGTQLQRYIHGPGAGDDPLIRYPGSSSARNDAHYFYADRLGSIVQEVKRDGTVTAINSYDAYGIPGASSGINNQGRFRYTGQTWIAELGMYYYKARMYSPTLGRFMQTDPIGYSDGMNIYAYVGNDPVNMVDLSGLEIVVTGHRSCPKGHTCISGDELRDFLRNIRNTLPADFINGHELFSYEILVEADDEENEPQNAIPCDAAGCVNPDPSTWNPGPPAPKKRLFDTHWCGVGGEGPTTSPLDEACKAHDQCYTDNGFTAGSNFNPAAGSALQECNQALCGASRGQGTPGFLVRQYFEGAPWPGNACQ